MNRPLPDPPADHEPDTLTGTEVAEMEQALGALPLAEPSPMLDHRVAATLQAARGDAPTAHNGVAQPALSHPARSWWLTGLAVAAVVALLAALGLSLYLQRGNAPAGPSIVDNTPTPTDPNNTAADPGTPGTAGTTDPAPVEQAGYRFHPEPVRLHWSRDLDQGLLTADGGQPVRAVRRQDVEQEVWVDPERGVTVQITRPRERLMVVKQPTF